MFSALYSTIKEFLDSKKWVMTIVGTILVAVMQHYGVDGHTVNLIAGIFGVYVAGQSVADLKK